ERLRAPVTLLGYRATAKVRGRTFEGVIVDESANLITLRTVDGNVVRLIKSNCEKLVLELGDGTRIRTEGRRLLGTPAERLKRQRRGWEKPD
ncbi:MAG: ribonuclease P protein subunit, partial [Aigarchaeota archaeon]|nr:ribonuclease P protein subunit [Aigarchaeota archaeon]